MTMETGTMPAQNRVDALLDRVEHALLNAGVARGMRASVLQSVESGVLSRAAARASAAGGGRQPTAADVAGAVEEVAGDGTASAALDGRGWRQFVQGLMPRRSRAAFWGAVCIGASLLPLVALLVIFALISPNGWRLEATFPRDRVHAEVGAEGSQSTTLFQATGPEGYLRASTDAQTPEQRFLWLLLPISPLALAGTLLGVLAVVQIASSRGKVVGIAPALFATLFYPVFVTLMIAWL